MCAKADHCVCFGPWLIEHWTEHRRCCGIESEGVANGRMTNGFKIEHTANGHAAMHQIAGQIIAKRGPVCRQHDTGEMSPGRVSADHDVIPVEAKLFAIAPEMGKGAANLVDELLKRDRGTKSVLDIGKTNSRLNKGVREESVILLLVPLPVAAMDKREERWVFVFWQEQVECFARAVAVSEVD